MKLLIVGLLALSVVSAKTLNIVQPMPCAFICWRKDQACKDACAPCEDCQKGGMPPHEHPVPYETCAHNCMMQHRVDQKAQTKCITACICAVQRCPDGWTWTA